MSAIFSRRTAVNKAALLLAGLLLAPGAPRAAGLDADAVVARTRARADAPRVAECLLRDSCPLADDPRLTTLFARAYRFTSRTDPKVRDMHEAGCSARLDMRPDGDYRFVYFKTETGDTVPAEEVVRAVTANWNRAWAARIREAMKFFGDRYVVDTDWPVEMAMRNACHMTSPHCATVQELRDQGYDVSVSDDARFVMTPRRPDGAAAVESSGPASAPGLPDAGNVENAFEGR
jgi:hypothetical protein